MLMVFFKLKQRSEIIYWLLLDVEEVKVRPVRSKSSRNKSC